MPFSFTHTLLVADLSLSGLRSASRIFPGGRFEMRRTGQICGANNFNRALVMAGIA
jgi:hypothetical protein